MSIYGLAAAVKEWENNKFERARTLLDRVRRQAASARVFMKLILLERELHATKVKEELDSCFFYTFCTEKNDKEE